MPSASWLEIFWLISRSCEDGFPLTIVPSSIPIPCRKDKALLYRSLKMEILNGESACTKTSHNKWRQKEVKMLPEVLYRGSKCRLKRWCTCTEKRDCLSTPIQGMWLWKVETCLLLWIRRLESWYRGNEADLLGPEQGVQCVEGGDDCVHRWDTGEERGV